MRPVWAEIDLNAVAHNIQGLRKITIPSAKILAIVKANSYGHGAEEISKVLLKNGADELGVALLDEALALREAGFDVPILILGFTPVTQVADVVRYNLKQTVFSWELAKALSDAAVEAGTKAVIHIKIDTGMGRIGFPPRIQTIETILKISRLPGIEIEGLFSHFACADEHDQSFTRAQFALFMDFDSQLRKAGLEIPVRHVANSATLIEFPEMHLEMVRPGVSLYGMYPSPNVSHEKVKLKPVMTLKARVAYLKEVPAGTTVSYGRTHTTAAATRIATLPLGYADGYNRLLSSRGEVLIHGHRAPVVGRVTMDQIMVDVGHIDGVHVMDEAVLIGTQGGETILADDIAQKIGTINYEITCMVSNRVPRKYLI